MKCFNSFFFGTFFEKHRSQCSAPFLNVLTTVNSTVSFKLFRQSVLRKDHRGDVCEPLESLFLEGQSDIFSISTSPFPSYKVVPYTQAIPMQPVTLHFLTMEFFPYLVFFLVKPFLQVNEDRIIFFSLRRHNSALTALILRLTIMLSTQTRHVFQISLLSINSIKRVHCIFEREYLSAEKFNYRWIW